MLVANATSVNLFTVQREALAPNIGLEKQWLVVSGQWLVKLKPAEAGQSAMTRTMFDN